MSETATLTKTFELLIPEHVRAARDWKPGQEFAFVDRGGAVLLVPVPAASELLGLVRGADPDGYRDRDDRT